MERLQYQLWGLLFPSSKNVVCGWLHFSTTWFPLYLLLTNTYCLFRFSESFFILRHRSWAVWISVWYYFCDISILFSSFWSLIEATFSSWILSNGLSGVHNLRVSSIKHKDYCFPSSANFVEGSIFRQLYVLSCFWLTTWAGLKLKMFAVNFERDRQISAMIVVIWSPPLFS